MNEQIKEIAQRLVGLRDLLYIPACSMAGVCGITEEKYLLMESGTVDIPVSVLLRIAEEYGVPMGVLMFGDEPKLGSYFVTRKGRGETVERRKAYKYQSLAAGFKGRTGDPFLVTVHPKPEDTPVSLNSHPGQEFNMVMNGRLLLTIDEKELILEEGDCVYFNAELPHAMKALEGKEVTFLAVVIAKINEPEGGW
jgi:mannose-6-phosphate isomerase-like protein (cupin superfamily)